MPTPSATPNPSAESEGAPTFTPLYQQIRERLVRELRSGSWRPGEAIPPELELAARYRVSHGTVRKAIDALVAEHLLTRRQGKGTFVATHAEPRKRYRFLRLADAEGATPQLQRRVLDVETQNADDALAVRLGLGAGEPVLRLRRVLSEADRPVVFETIWLPAAMFAGLSASGLQAAQGPLYAWFETDFGVQMVRADERLRAVPAGPEAATELGVALGFPLLEVERLAYTYEDRPVEWRRGLYVTDHHHYRNALA